MRYIRVKEARGGRCKVRVRGGRWEVGGRREVGGESEGEGEDQCRGGRYGVKPVKGGRG